MRLTGFRGRIVLHLGHGHAELLRNQTNRLAKGDVLNLLDELEHVAGFTTAKAVIELAGSVNGKRWRLFLVEGTDSLIVLCPRLAQRYVLAHDANDVSLRAQLLFKVGTHRKVVPEPQCYSSLGRAVEKGGRHESCSDYAVPDSSDPI